MRQDFVYAGYMSVKIKRIEVYGTGNTLAVPYYHIQFKDAQKDIVVGGIRMDRGKDTILEAKEETPFIYSMAMLEALSIEESSKKEQLLRAEYESFKSRKPLLCSEDYNDAYQTIIDVYLNPETKEVKYAIAGSPIIYRKDGKGGMIHYLDGRMMSSSANSTNNVQR